MILNVEKEERAVKSLGDSIGYGMIMQLAENLWNKVSPRDFKRSI